MYRLVQALLQHHKLALLLLVILQPLTFKLQLKKLALNAVTLPT